MTDLTNETFLDAHGCLPTDHPAWEAQLELEDEMRSAGIARFEKSLEINRDKERESSNLSSRRMIIHAHGQVVEGINAFFESARSGRAGKKHTAIHYLADADVDVLAHLSLRTLFDNVSLRATITKVATRLASLVEDELFFRNFRGHDEDAYDYAKRKIKAQSQNPTYQKRVMSKHARAKGTEWTEWAPDVRVKIGTKLIEIVLDTTGLFKKVRQTEGAKKTNIYVVASEATLDWLSTENARLAPLAPVYLPTLVPPRPWTSPFRGGYWTRRVRNLRLIKTGNRAYLSDLESVDLSTVYASVNAMQNTAWRIRRSG